MRGSVGRRLVEVDMGVTASVSIKSLLYRVRCLSYYCLVVPFHHCILPIICQIWIAMKCGCSPQRPPADTAMEVALVTVSPLRIFNIQINNISRSGAAQQSPASPARSQHWWLFLIYASAAAGCWVTRPDIHLLAPITHTTKENCDNIRTEKYFFPKYISNKWFY